MDIRKWALETLTNPNRGYTRSDRQFQQWKTTSIARRVGSGRSVNPKIGISQQSGSMTTATTGQDNTWR
jgi:hypothetical protein